MLALLLGLFQPPADAPAVEKKAAALVAQLGDPAFRKREAAARDLLALGTPAKAAIEAGLTNPDIEIRDRCKKLLPAVWETSFQARLDRLKEDPEFRRKHDLPGWDRLARRASSEVLGRYVKVMAAQREGVRDLESEPAKLAATYEARLADSNNLEPENVLQLRRGEAQISLAFETDELAYWLLILSDPRAVRAMPAENGVRHAYLKNLLNTASSQRHWKGANAAIIEPAIVAAVSAFVADEAGGEIVAVGFALAERREIKGMADIAADWIARRHSNRKLLDQAIGVLGMAGRPEHLKALAALMVDETALATDYFKDYTTQTRDFALAMALRIEGQLPREYGFAMDADQSVPRSYSYGFKTEADRTRAFDRYAEYLRK